MARPIKQGLDYFPMDVETDDKFELIEAKHGIAGFGVLIKLFQRIYKEGYYLKLSDELLLIFGKRINVDINKVNEIINDCIKYNIFNKEMFDKHNILTSTGIQKRFISAIERRKDVEMIKNYIIVDINSINDNINLIDTDISTQSKVKESIVKEKTWRTDFETYKNGLREVYNSLISDDEFIKTQEKYNPNVDIYLSIEKACVNYWATDVGWKKKKQSKSVDLNWKSTLINSLKFDKVYKSKEEKIITNVETKYKRYRQSTAASN